MKIDEIIGKIFVDNNNENFGTIRHFSGTIPPESNIEKDRPIAEDDCGNLFVLRNETVCFWDHETNEITELARNIFDFKNSCIEPPEVELDQNQIESVWVDPEFAKEFGIDVPEDGWKKKP